MKINVIAPNPTPQEVGQPAVGERVSLPPTAPVDTTPLKSQYDKAVEQLVNLNGSRPWTWIVIHHSSNKDGITHEWDAIRNYHTNWRLDGGIITFQEALKLQAQGKVVIAPWVDIGYNFGISHDGDTYNYQVGRSLIIPGAHAINFNQKAIGICVCGNFMKVSPNETQLEMLVALIKYLMKQFNIPVNNVVGHKETYTILKEPIGTECPGDKFDLDDLRKRLA